MVLCVLLHCTSALSDRCRVVVCCAARERHRESIIGMDPEARAATLRALNRVGVRAPDAQMTGGCCQFYVKKKAEGLDSPQAEAALFRMLAEAEASVAVPPPPHTIHEFDQPEFASAIKQVVVGICVQLGTCSLEDIHKRVVGMGVSTVPLAISDVRTVVEALLADSQLENMYTDDGDKYKVAKSVAKSCVEPSPAPPTSLDATTLAQRVKDLEAALATSEAERERLAKRVEHLETKPWRPKPRGRVPQGATGWDGVKGEWDYPPGYSGPRKRAAPASSPKRAKRRPAKKKKWDGETSEEEQSPPPAVAAGAIFIDGGQLWLVYKREGRECNVEGVVRTLDVAYSYPAKGPKPTEQNYLKVCEQLGVAAVARLITATADAAQACARADRKKRDGDRRRRDDEKRRREAAALAALPPPKLPPPPKRVPALPASDLLGRAVRVVVADAPSDTRGTVDSVAHGVCRVAWADGSSSDVLAADATAMLAPLVV